MDTEESQNISKYLTVLRNAETDNEKFAALLMVTKLTKYETCNKDIKKRILDAIGVKFFSRLLKCRTVPEDCPIHIYKSVALSVLSALCSEPDVACSLVLTENVTSFNNIILVNPRDADSEVRQLVDDTYDCLNSLCHTTTGLKHLLKAKSISAFCEAVISQSYGYKKALDLIYCLVSCFGSDSWNGCEEAFHALLNFLGKQFQEDQSLEKFELCKALVCLLSAAPNDKEKVMDPQWIQPIVRGLDNVLRSKIGAIQREEALKLASAMVQVCGIYSMQPPYTQDLKLFLLTTHLCCVEVRMVLEDTDLTQVLNKGRLLSTCYTFLESIINHLTSSPSLSLDDRQVLQLHSAMVGAFGAVINFLKHVAADTSIQWNSIILATVRVLGAWLAEETAALRQEIFELIPFLVQISKKCIPTHTPATTSTTSDLNNVDRRNNNNIASEGNNKTHAITNDMETECGVLTLNQASTPSSPADVKNIDTGKSSVEMECVNEASHCCHGDPESCDIKVDNDVSCGHLVENCDMDDDSSVIPTQKSVKFIEVNQSEHLNVKGLDDLDSEMASNVKGLDDLDIEMAIETKQNARLEKCILDEQELHDLHMKADILHYLLPALCHLTTETEPRHILLECGALSVLDLYFWRLWKKFISEPHSYETLSGLVIVCNIFLNLTVVDPDLVAKKHEFLHVLLLVVKGIDVAEGNEEYIVLWSHMVTLGLMLLRVLYKKTDEGFESESVSRFFLSSVRYLSGAYTVKYKKRALDLTDTYKAAWDQISHTWFLSMQAISACIPLYKELPSLLLKTGWLASALKLFSDVKGNTVMDEIKHCYSLLLRSAAECDKSAKAVIKEKGGDMIARMLKCKDLEDILKAP